MIENQAIQAYLGALKCVIDQCNLPDTIYAALREHGVENLNISQSKLYVRRQLKCDSSPNSTIMLIPGYSQTPVRYLLAAENGSGKTTLLKMTALELINRVDDFGVCPILLQPNQVNTIASSNDVRTLTEILAEVMRELVQPVHEERQEFIADLISYLGPALSSGSVLLLLDDLDFWPKESIKALNDALMEFRDIHVIATDTSHTYCQLKDSLPGFADLVPVSFGRLPDADSFCKAIMRAIPQLKKSSRGFDLWFSAVCDLFSNCPIDIIWAVLSSGIFSDESDPAPNSFNLAAFLEALLLHRVIRCAGTMKEDGINHGELFRELQYRAYIAMNNFFIEPEGKVCVSGISESAAKFCIEAGILSCEGLVKKDYYFTPPSWAWYLAAQYAVTHKKEGLGLTKLALSSEEYIEGFIPLVISMDEVLGDIVLGMVLQKSRQDNESAVELLESTIALCPLEVFSDPDTRQQVLELIFASAHFTEYIEHIPRQLAHLCLTLPWIPDDWISSVLTLCEADRYSYAKEFLFIIRGYDNYSDALQREIGQFFQTSKQFFQANKPTSGSRQRTDLVTPLRNISSGAKRFLGRISKRMRYRTIDYNGREYYVAEDFTLGQHRFLALVGAKGRYDFFIQKVIQKGEKEYLTKLDSNLEFDYVMDHLDAILEEEAGAGGLDEIKLNLASFVNESILLRNIEY